MLISVDFWKSMPGFAMDSWTRVDLKDIFLVDMKSFRSRSEGRTQSKFSADEQI